MIKIGAMKTLNQSLLIAFCAAVVASAVSGQELRLEGRVIDGDGKPVAEAGVYGFYLDGDDRSIKTKTDSNGDFELDRRPVPIVLFINSEDRTLAGLMVSPANEEEIAIEVYPHIAVTGQFVDVETGTPRPNTEIVYQVTYQIGNGAYRSCHIEESTTDADGRFKFKEVVVGGDATISEITKRSRWCVDAIDRSGNVTRSASILINVDIP